MNALLAVAGLLLVGALSPGPNNLVVLRTASRSGLAGALPAIAGIVGGGLCLLAIAALGLGRASDLLPGLRTAIAMAGALYLMWMGLRLIAARPDTGDTPPLPAGITRLFAFQFLNPKSWVLVFTAAAALPGVGVVGTVARLAPLFILIPIACLLLWAALGAALARQLARPAIARWSDRILGVLLFAAAAALLFS